MNLKRNETDKDEALGEDFKTKQHMFPYWPLWMIAERHSSYFEVFELLAKAHLSPTSSYSLVF